MATCRPRLHPVEAAGQHRVDDEEPAVVDEADEELAEAVDRAEAVPLERREALGAGPHEPGDGRLGAGHGEARRRLQPLLPVLKRLRVPIVAMTGRPASTLARHADHVLDAGVAQRYGLAKQVDAVKNIRAVRKQHMVHNSYLPRMEIDAQTYRVRADGELLTCEPAVRLPMAQRYFLF